MLTATAVEIVDTDQPNSARSGSISTPGTARKAAAPTSARKVTAATHQAGWTRRARAGAERVTCTASPTPGTVRMRGIPYPRHCARLPRCDQRLDRNRHGVPPHLVDWAYRR